MMRSIPGGGGPGRGGPPPPDAGYTLGLDPFEQKRFEVFKMAFDAVTDPKLRVDLAVAYLTGRPSAMYFSSPIVAVPQVAT